jgi:universal stress protein A
MTVPLRRILVCIQFSESCPTTVRYACALAERFHAELHLLHVLEETPEPDVAALTPDEASFATGGEDKLLDGVIPEEWEQKIICRRIVVFGVPHVEITRYAWEHRIDVIVVGTSPRSVWRRLFLGSVADQVVHHAPCPVFVVPYPERKYPLP